MKFLDKYPNCVGCPVSQYCGTMCMSVKLCNSYSEPSFDTEEDKLWDTQQEAMVMDLDDLNY